LSARSDATSETDRLAAELIRQAGLAGVSPDDWFAKRLRWLVKARLLVQALGKLLATVALVVGFCYSVCLVMLTGHVPPGWDYLMGGSGIGAGAVGAIGVRQAVAARWRKNGPPPDDAS